MKQIVKQKEQTRTGFGVASLIMILLVLCLALMGVLSLMSARSDQALSKRYAQLAFGYAQAAADAQRSVAALDEALWAARQSSAGEEEYAARCEQIEQAGMATVTWMDAYSAVLCVDAGEERQIEVRIDRMNWEKAPERRFTVTAHRLIDAKEWQETDGLILMGM